MQSSSIDLATVRSALLSTVSGLTSDQVRSHKRVSQQGRAALLAHVRAHAPVCAHRARGRALNDTLLPRRSR
eukprot:5978074-Prymnesium_polylepis.1